jgi:hypothetical protein
MVIEYAAAPDGQQQPLVELWKKNMDALGVNMQFRREKWPDLLKLSKAEKLQMWGAGLERRGARRRLVLRDALRAQRRPGQPLALQAAGVRPPLRARQAPARRARAQRPLPRR